MIQTLKATSKATVALPEDRPVSLFCLHCTENTAKLICIMLEMELVHLWSPWERYVCCQQYKS
jgi:hypothetical protein